MPDMMLLCAVEQPGSSSAPYAEGRWFESTRRNHNHHKSSLQTGFPSNGGMPGVSKFVGCLIR